MRPWEIARLTDHQIINDYLFPQLKKQEELERRQKGLPAANDEPEEPGAAPSKDYMILVLMALGMSKEAAEKEYAAQLAINQGV
jgi:hypothetical protein